MPRRPRVEMAGYHHVVNRGVEQRDIFLEPKDYEKFLEIVCEACVGFNAALHSYCLMTNHYHLLLETRQENLSKVMRTINSNYASYFNRKNRRVGHLWQGRFKSWYVTDEAYLYTLVKYIEMNPVKAGLVKAPSTYPYGSFQVFCGQQPAMKCLEESVILVRFSKEERVDFFDSWYDEDVVQEIEKASSLVVSLVPSPVLSNEELKKLFVDYSSKDERDEKVIEAIKKGFSQQQIATVLGISQPAVSLIVKKMA